MKENGIDKYNLFTPAKVAVLVFVLYLAIGLIAVKDYGISTDEPRQRTSSLSTYVYVMGDRMLASDNEAVREAALSAEDFMTWSDRYYGTALQEVTVLIERINGFEMPLQQVFMMRHVFVFLNYFAAGVFFFLLLRRRFGNSWITVAGALMYILYPRFFGEAFYNIKDLLFYSWFVISAYFVVRWLEDGRARFLILSAAALAVATNTRILGLSLLLLACAFAIAMGIRHRKRPLRVIGGPALLLVLTFVFYAAITPFVWSNPVRNTAAIFRHFLHYQPWNETHFYLGEMITREVPWHYLPVWLAATVPLLYIALFVFGAVAIFAGLKAWAGRRAPHLRFHEMFFAALFFLTLLGFIALHISMYDGWRHAYCLFFPFLYIAVYGLERASASLRGKRPAPGRVFACVIAACLCLQLSWIAMNHPYQYVYFNPVGKQIAKESLALDYWGVSHADLLRYALAGDDRPHVPIDGGRWGWEDALILTDDEKERIVWTYTETADYFIQDSRIAYEERVPPADFTEYKAITVDGMKIATLYKRTEPPAGLDPGAWDKVVRFESSAGTDPSALCDGDFGTFWSTEEPQQSGDYMLFEFSEPVDYDYVNMATSRYVRDYPKHLSIFTSVDGDEWVYAPRIHDFWFEAEAAPYRFLKLECGAVDDTSPWTVYELGFGRKGPAPLNPEP